MTDRTQAALNRWGKIVALIVAFFVLMAAVESRGDDRYVKRVDYEKELGEMKGDVRVIRQAVCSQSPQSCAAVQP